MNRITLIGNSGADAEVKTSQGGKSYCFISIATAEKQQDGTFTSTWHRVKMFGKTAEIYGPQIKKGSKVFVEGKMTYDEYTDKNGNKKSSADVMAFQVGVIMKEPQQNDAYAQGQTNQQAARPKSAPPSGAAHEPPPMGGLPDYGDIPW